MSLLLVAPPTLWGVKGIGKHGEWSYFDVQKKFLGPSFKTFPGEHLGLRSIQSFCSHQGLDVEVINGHVSNHLTIDETWESMCDMYERKGGISVVGFTGTLEMFEENAELAKRVKENWPNTVTVLGHDFATLNYSSILESYPQIDIVNRGEGELSISELTKTVNSGESLENVPNITWRNEKGEVVANPMHHGIDLTELPWPDRGDLHEVLNMGMSAAVYTTRGCQFRCTFCTTGATANLLKGKNSYRQRSVEDVIDEIEFLVKTYNLEWIIIVDDLFVGKDKISRDRAAAFANEIIRRNIRVNFKIDCRIDSIDEELFTLLSEAGVKELFVGIETASDEQLSFYKKTYDSKADSQFDVIKKKLKIVHDLGMTVVPGILTYHPEVTYDQLKLTADLIDLCEYKASYPYWSTIVLYPGTPLYEQYKDEEWVVGEWPYIGWKFKDKKSEIHYRKVKEAAKNNRWDHQYVRSAFLEALETWDDKTYIKESDLVVT